jgi:hypothetical protein
LAHQWREKEEEEVWRLFRGVYETALSPLRLFFYTNKSSLSRKTRRRKTKMCDQIYIQMFRRKNICRRAEWYPCCVFYPSFYSSYSNFSCHFHS